MNVNDYIASGILESYALGLVSPQEKQEVECMLHIYPEIQQELSKIMEAVEAMSQVQAIPVPSHVKQKLFTQLKNETKPEKEAKITPIRTEQGSSSLFRLAAAACLVFAVVMSVLYFSNDQTTELKSMQAKLNEVENNLSKKEKILAQLEKESAYTKDELAMFRDPEFKTVFLKTTNNKPTNSLAIVCCNPKKGKTVIAIEDLPKPSADKQYQLWAIVDGKPVDMGVLPADTVGKRFFEVKNIESAQAYAITLEKTGGSASPDLSQLWVMGQMQ